MIEISQTAGQISLRGSLTVDTVTSAYRQSPQFSGGKMTVDLSSVEEMDSAGLSLLVYWKQQSEGQNCDLVYLDPPPQIVTMSKISGLESIIDKRAESASVEAI